MAENTTSPSRKNLVILGGSYSGISTAHYLLKHGIPQLPDQGSYQVIVVSASSKALCRPACPRALISDDMLPQEKLFVDITQAFEQYPKNSFRFIEGTATKLDHGNRTVSITLPTGSIEALDFYALVIATGASTPSPLHGLNRDVEYLRKSWAAFREALPKANTIVIAGGGPAGIETAGELGEYLNGRPGWFSSRPATLKVSITVVNASSKILPALRPALAKKAETYLSNVGVKILNKARVKSVLPRSAGIIDVASKATITLDDSSTLNADLYIPAIGTCPNTSFISSSLLKPNNRILTNATTLRVDAAGPRIYAIGDVSSAARPGIHIILEAVPVLCANMKRDLLLASSDNPNKKFNEKSTFDEDRMFKEDTRETQLVPIGKSKGVGAAMGYALPSWLVWLIKGRDYWLWTTGSLWSGKQWAKEK